MTKFDPLSKVKLIVQEMLSFMNIVIIVVLELFLVMILHMLELLIMNFLQQEFQVVDILESILILVIVANGMI